MYNFSAQKIGLGINPISCIPFISPVREQSAKRQPYVPEGRITRRHSWWFDWTTPQQASTRTNCLVHWNWHLLIKSRVNQFSAKLPVWMYPVDGQDFPYQHAFYWKDYLFSLGFRNQFFRTKHWFRYQPDKLHPIHLTSAGTIRKAATPRTRRPCYPKAFVVIWLDYPSTSFNPHQLPCALKLTLTPSEFQ